MGKPKWKSTSNCFKDISELSWWGVGLCLEVEQSDNDYWTWTLCAHDLGDENCEIIWFAESMDVFDYEDEAANAAYRHADQYYQRRDR